MAKKVKAYSESELIDLFQLNRLSGNAKHPLMQDWTNAHVDLQGWELALFEDTYRDMPEKITGWNEEMLKMNFIAFVLRLGHLRETDRYKTFFESTLEATINGIFLKVRTDMMIATGILETPKVPYFYFQEYKKVKDPKGDPTAQLLEAFLIAQSQNNNQKPLYGCTVYGREWEFLVMENKTYCISRTYNCTNRDDLLQIIAILRKFKAVLENQLL